MATSSLITSPFFVASHLLAMIMMICHKMPQVQGISCFACNPIVTFVPFNDGTVSMEDLVDVETSVYSKGKGPCKDLTTMDINDIKKDPRFVVNCSQGCSSGTVSSLRYRMNVTITRSSQDVTQLTRAIVVEDGEFRACFESTIKNLRGRQDGEDCGDFEDHIRNGTNNMNAAEASIQVTRAREGGAIKVCGCGGEFCNGDGKGSGGTELTAKNSGWRNTGDFVLGVLAMYLQIFVQILASI